MYQYSCCRSLARRGAAVGSTLGSSECMIDLQPRRHAPPPGAADCWALALNDGVPPATRWVRGLTDHSGLRPVVSVLRRRLAGKTRASAKWCLCFVYVVLASERLTTTLHVYRSYKSTRMHSPTCIRAST